MLTPANSFFAISAELGFESAMLYGAEGVALPTEAGRNCRAGRLSSQLEKCSPVEHFSKVQSERIGEIQI
jgi:hypothetical protein